MERAGRRSFAVPARLRGGKELLNLQFAAQNGVPDVQGIFAALVFPGSLPKSNEEPRARTRLLGRHTD